MSPMFLRSVATGQPDEDHQRYDQNIADSRSFTRRVFAESKMLDSLSRPETQERIQFLSSSPARNV
jgi:hypothetical protein